MCRWMAYSGQDVFLEDLLFKAKHNLIDQSMCSKSIETPTNGDGFGVGWYSEAVRPGVFRSIRPAWNDFNLRELAAHIRSPLFMAHVRATSHATVQETNCHPFRYKNWLFVHNGEILEIEKIRRDLLMAVDPKLFEYILGSTDSEIMFFLALTFGLEREPLQGLAKMVAFVEDTAQKRGIQKPLWMTIGLSDGIALYAVRYASDGDAPTLYYNRDLEAVCHLNPELRHHYGESARAIVSEPIGLFPEIWQEVPQNSIVQVKDGYLKTSTFIHHL
jgi:predicted glutamine amidotransferase